MDESYFFHRKYHRGSLRRGMWVVGIVERGTGRCYLEIVARRDAETLERIITSHVLPGTVIITDAWGGYVNVATINNGVYMGIVWALLQNFRLRGRIEFGQIELHYLLEINCNLGSNTDVMFLVAATIQALGTTPGIVSEVGRWREELGKEVPDTLHLGGLNTTLRPWEDSNLWEFRTWALAMEVTQRFIGQRSIGSEAMFLTSSTDILGQTDPEWWKLEVIALTLFSVKKASWFWPLLGTVNLNP
jgi:hypothetical protein